MTLPSVAPNFDSLISIVWTGGTYTGVEELIATF